MKFLNDMKISLLHIAFIWIAFAACQKESQVIPDDNIVVPIDSPKVFIQYTIPQGQQFSNLSSYIKTSYDTLSFVVRFDSSAIYKTIDPANQEDINKLFGFSDNNGQHHEFSARFGWRWSNNALRLFGYIYNNSQLSAQEIGTVQIGTEYNCSIIVGSNTYLFNLNGKSINMPRSSTTAKAEGYKLFPYFGGDELAPHTISIWIKEL